MSFAIALLHVFPATSVLNVTTLFSPKFYSSLCKQKIPHLDLKSKKASHFQGKGSSLFPPSLALSHSLPPLQNVTAALVSARGNLATVLVLLQNLREKVAAVSLPK